MQRRGLTDWYNLEKLKVIEEEVSKAVPGLEVSTNLCWA